MAISLNGSNKRGEIHEKNVTLVYPDIVGGECPGS